MNQAAILRSALRLPPAPRQRCTALAAVLLCLGGLALSAYTLTLHYRPQLSACTLQGGGGGCVATITGPKSTIVHVPVPVYGLVFFVGMLVLCLPGAWHTASPWPARLRQAAIAVGVATVLYLMYTELITLDTFCEYCTAVHAITFALFLLIITDAALSPLADLDDPSGAAEA